ncbi:hypothetical protein PG994_013543 [Apiospora phragmitis]|uniref:protein S-acyltransferase n=1 Tax=Apiospora phragmitis TaxID=2905665 RepID=A0ABR1T8X6_9PEZI
MLYLPAELLLEIGTNINNVSDLLHFGLACRGLSSFLDELYRRDVQEGNCWALLLACRNGNLALAKRSLEAGASVDHLFFDQTMATRAPWSFSNERARVSCLAGSPLAIAVQFRHVAMVRFLLEDKGANPNQWDGWAASYHDQVWYPIHWAVACQAATRDHEDGCQTDPKRCCGFASPPSPAIVALLLRHGADPDQRTFPGPRRCPGDEASIVHWETLQPLHLTGCDHVAPAVLRRLLDAGADPRAPGVYWGCSQRCADAKPWLFERLGPLRPFANEVREAKLLLLAARHGREDRHPWRFGGAAPASTLHVLTPSRLRTLLFLTGSAESEPVVLASGVFAMLEA